MRYTHVISDPVGVISRVQGNEATATHSNRNEVWNVTQAYGSFSVSASILLGHLPFLDQLLILPASSYPPLTCHGIYFLKAFAYSFFSL